jgi:recombination protein U
MGNSKKIGNRFQEDFVRSVPKNCLIERYKDAPTRFKKVDNPADFWIFNGSFIVLIECKTTQEITFSLSNIRRNQLLKMLQRVQRKNVFGGYLIEYRELQKCYFIPVESFLNWFISRDRESLKLSWVRENGIEIPGHKLQTRYRWDVSVLLNWMEENCHAEY